MDESTQQDGTIAEVVLAYGQYILSYPAYKLEIRGKYPEWVFSAAYEILRHLSRVEDANQLDMMRFTRDEDDDPIEVEMDTEYQRYQMEARYDAIPQCGVTYDGEDYRWIAEPGRADDEEPVMERIIHPEIRPRASSHNGDATNVEAQPAASVPKASVPTGDGPPDFDMAAEMAKLDNIPGLN